MDRRTKVIINSGCILFVVISILLYAFQSFHRAAIIGVVYIPQYSSHANKYAEILKLASEGSRSIVVKAFAPTTNTNHLLVQAAANAALEDESVSLVISIGAICSQTVVAISKRRKSVKPIIFIGADAPVKLGLVESLDVSGGVVSGVVAESSYMLNVGELLMAAKPKVKKILLPFYGRNASNVVEKQVRLIVQYCSNYQIQVEPLVIDNIQNAPLMITNFITEYDALMYLEDDALTSLASSLAKICTQYGVTLFAGSIDVADNAAFCYAIEPKIEAREAFKLVEKILFEGVDPGSIAVVQPKDCRDFVINVGACRRQGVKDVDPAAIINRIRSNPALSLIHNRIVVMP